MAGRQASILCLCVYVCGCVCVCVCERERARDTGRERARKRDRGWEGEGERASERERARERDRERERERGVRLRRSPHDSACRTGSALGRSLAHTHTHTHHHRPPVPHQGTPSRRCRANMAHTRQPRPDYGLGFQVKSLEIFQVVPYSLGSGLHCDLS